MKVFCPLLVLVLISCDVSQSAKAQNQNNVWADYIVIFNHANLTNDKTEICQEIEAGGPRYRVVPYDGNARI